MIKYFVVKTKVEIEGEKYDTYGITGNSVTINDISINKKIVKKFIDKINKAGDVEPLHIPDIVDDFLVDNIIL